MPFSYKQQTTTEHSGVINLQKLYDTGRYISYSDLASFQSVPPSLTRPPIEFLRHPALFTSRLSSRRIIRTLSKESTRESHNASVIAKAQQQPFEIEGKPLDKQQIEAVVANEDAQLVMAAAGSGKTLSLLAKCRYLVEELHINPKRILTISFTKASANELAERLTKLGIHVDGKTFHALGNAIVGNGTRKIINQTQQRAIIDTILNKKMKNDETFARHYNDYILNYFSMPTPPIESKTLEDLVRSNRAFQAYTLKPVSIDKSTYTQDKTTYHGEKVRSKEEQIIANFLYVNNVSYEYEKPFPGYNNYRPDFTITAYGEPIYLEHQGVNRQGKTRPDIDNKYYHQKMKWNRDYHAKGGTRLIETYSYEFQEGTVLHHLEQRLKAQGVEIIRRQESDIATLIKNSYSLDVIKFNELLLTFLGLLKTSEVTLATIRKRSHHIKNHYQRIRTDAFLTLFEEIYELYEATLRSTEAIDFSDMIVTAAETLPSLPAGVMEYDHILVDEIQDLSGARYRLLKALLDRTPRSKLFAVGDDWQAIFRFAGSDLTLLQDFDSRFERFTRHSVIEQTHRFNDPLLDVTTTFIKKNPTQVQKNPYSNIKVNTVLTVNNSATLETDATALDDELQKLISTYGMDIIAKRTIYLIGRYKRDVKRLLGYQDPRLQFRALDEEEKQIEWTNVKTGYHLKLMFMTMHSSKGLTCDHTFILNGNGGAMGIPAERDNDPVIQLLLAHEDSYPNAEERRLFYVALTRAKLSTTIITTSHNPSSFVQELNIPEVTIAEAPQTRCPACHIGYLILRNSAYGEFYGCTNFGYGCSYTVRTIIS